MSHASPVNMKVHLHIGSRGSQVPWTHSTKQPVAILITVKDRVPSGVGVGVDVDEDEEESSANPFKNSRRKNSNE